MFLSSSLFIHSFLVGGVSGRKSDTHSFEREPERHRKTERQTDRQRGRETDRQTESYSFGTEVLRITPIPSISHLTCLAR